jgi:hypothetical protein
MDRKKKPFVSMWEMKCSPLSLRNGLRLRNGLHNQESRKKGRGRDLLARCKEVCAKLLRP